MITLLVNSSSGTLLYDDVLHNVFSGDDAPLKSLVRSDLLRLEPGLSRGGDRLTAGSPVMREAFHRLVHHQEKLRPGMDLLVTKHKLAAEQAKINAVEEELTRLARIEEQLLPSSQLQLAGDAWWSAADKAAWRPHTDDANLAALRTRTAFLLGLLDESHRKAASLDEQRKKCEAAVKKIKEVQ